VQGFVLSNMSHTFFFFHFTSNIYSLSAWSGLLRNSNVTCARTWLYLGSCLGQHTISAVVQHCDLEGVIVILEYQKVLGEKVKSDFERTVEPY
jgi:hypothetical protein